MLTIRNVSKTYGRSAGKAVDNLSFEAKTGEIFGFLGPNGAGKTTTIKMITGVILALYRSTLQASRFDSGAAAAVCVRPYDLLL